LVFTVRFEAINQNDRRSIERQRRRISGAESLEIQSRRQTGFEKFNCNRSAHVKKPKVKYLYLNSLILAILFWTVYVQIPDRDGPIRTAHAASADSASGAAVIELSGRGLDPVAASPDGNIWATVETDGKIVLWDTAAGQMLLALPAQAGSPAQGILFGPDGKTLASVSDDSVRIWDTLAGNVRLTLSRTVPMRALAFSPDGKWLAAVDAEAAVTLIDARSGSVARQLATGQDAVNAVAFSPDGKWLATGGQDDQTKLWDPATGEEAAALPGNGAVTALAFSPDGKRLATGSESEQVLLWNMADKLPQLLAGHDGAVIKVAFSADRNHLTSMAKTGQMIVWNLSDVSKQAVLQTSLPGAASTFQGSVAATSAANSSLSTALGRLNPAGGNAQKALATAASRNTAVAGKKKSPRNWKGVAALTVSPDGKLVGGSVDGQIKLWTAGGSERFTVPAHHGADVTAIVFSADGKELVSVGRDSELQIRNADNGRQIQTLAAHEHPIRAVAASPNGKLFASAGEETRIMVWDAEARKLKNILSGGHSDFVNALCFSADGTHLASAGADGSVLWWEVETGRLVHTLLGHTGEANAVACSPDGRQVASGGTDNKVYLWNVVTGSQAARFDGHQASVRAVAFNPNGQELASTGEDARILIWNTVAKQLDKQIPAAAQAVNALTYSPLGDLIAGGEDGQVSEWNPGTKQKILTIDINLPAPANNTGTGPGAAASDVLIADRIKSGSAPWAEDGIFERVLNWLIPAADAAIPDAPGGPILIVTTTSDPIGKYYAEILRTEGLNEFAMADISTINSTALNAYDVVILSKMTLSASQVTLFSNWVNAGGNLIAMRPDSQLAALLGINAAGGTLSNGYLQVDTSKAPGNGIANQTLQFHGTADRFTLAGASSLATLYSNATTATANPALTLRNVGTAGGQAAAFTYDLATSIVQTRQGNPGWAAQERDSFIPIRPDDKFYGDAVGDSQADWIDFGKLAIPQADEQQRLLANLILEMNRDRKPLPRFWYFPRGEKAVLIMTGDDHGNNGTQGRFDYFKSKSPSGCSVADWECVRGTSYIYPNTPLTNSQAAAYNADGFEVGLHLSTNCADFTPSSLRTFYTQQIGSFTSKYTSLPAPITQRHHCIAWSDWVTGAIVQLENGIRLDTSYYFWPPGWVQNRPGFFNGSAMPMRFVETNGSLIDVYNATSQMTDESGQTYPFTINTLLDKAIGQEGYYGAYVINAHTDVSITTEATAAVASAQARSVPIVSSKQMLDWLDGRNGSSFRSLSWSGSSLNFEVSRGAGANGLQAMVPVTAVNGALLTGINGPNGAVPSTTAIIKGVEYALFNAAAGTYSVTYGADSISPTVTSTFPANGATGVIQQPAVTATFSEPVDPSTVTTANFQLQAGSNPPVAVTVSYDPGTRTATLRPNTLLAESTLYTAKVLTGIKDLAGNALASTFTWSFTTQVQPCVSSPCTAWSGSTTPGTASVNDLNSVELGVKFRSDLDGTVTGIRFYQANTGTYTAALWSSTGQQLATASVTVTAAGWQQANFSTPVAITANTVYVASYHAPNGKYAGNTPYFANSGVDNVPLHLLKDGVSGGNGVYIYSAATTFPTNTYQSSNYWVDVAFRTASGPGPDTTAPTVTSRSPSAGATGVATGTAVTATFSEAMDPGTLTSSTFQLQAGSNPPVSATVSYAANTATLTPASALAANTAYTATVKGGSTGVKDLAGNPLAADATWSFTTGADACAPGSNPIVCENAKAGNPASEWNITGAGDVTIQGFATDISVNKGGTVGFKISTPASAYRLDIYRMGYYGGNGARKVATVNGTGPQNRAGGNPTSCLTNNTGLIDCGNWSVSTSWQVPADAVSGIYFARAVRTDTGGASHIVFVVRDDSSHSDLLFQTSDTTWQAYNNYGGNSLYGGTGPGTGGGSNGRAYKVSYNRPFNTRAVDNGQDWLFSSEYPMVRWLEANGYNVSYFTGVDSDRRGNLIGNHKVFLSVGHDEYWSGAQRGNIENARDVGGVNLAFFSGNEIFWKTRWENSIDGSNTAYRTLVSYKETHNFPNNTDPAGTWTGSWRDPRGDSLSPPKTDGGRPENALSGTIFEVNDGATTSILVPEADGKMRFWRNTSIATLAAGATATLPNGTLGYEWDEDLDNGSRPIGLVRLSSTTVSNAPVLQDFGSTYGTGTANHALTLYRDDNGALVFGAGTMQWSWGLDSNHDRAGTPVDVRMQQATVNLFADMGAQPGALQPGLQAATASTDTASPTSSISSPSAGATVQPGSQVTISGTATDTGGGRVGGVVVSVDGGSTWHQANGRGSWTYSWTVPSTSGTVNIKSRAVDDSGNLETAGAGINVNVGSGGSVACTGASSLWPTNPTPALVTDPDTASVELGVKFRSSVNGFICGIRFYKGSANTGTHTGKLWSSTGTLLASAPFQNETASGWQQVSFASPVAITANTTYVASYVAPVGRYAADTNFFTAAVTSGPLTALSNAEAGGNGVYRYGSGGFPNSTYQSSNYWVDVLFATN
jgi:WD40 repeat protein